MSAPVPSPLHAQLLQLLISAVEKSPDTGPEAVALCEYVYQKDIVPLLAAFRAWAISELKAVEVIAAQRAWNELNLLETKVEAKMVGCFGKK